MEQQKENIQYYFAKNFFMKKTAEQMVYNAKNWQWQRTCKEFRTWQKNIAAFARTASRHNFKEILYQEVHSGIYVPKYVSYKSR